ncbi:2-phosphosulfolactate phosphatase [Cryobacterium sp. BB307]|uniref:2-phosphosulfolactate phosphatase n=1 Tax=Cryobacterium sp. BB307 TaxID=2716317 RepID=UPI0014462A52
MSLPLSQNQYQVRFDWGIEGARTVAADVDVIVVVDVLSFTTMVGIALEYGIEVLPFDGTDAARYASEHAAVVAGKRGSPLSLSPASVGPEHAGTRVVVQSPNGSRISAALRGDVPVVAGSLRNRSAVAEWVLARQAEKANRLTVAVIASGEARGDGTSRFAVEDMLGAGAIIDALAEVGIDFCSPEAAAASAAFTGLRNAIGHLVSASASGKELEEWGFPQDVELASQVDSSTVVPVLRGDAFSITR